MSITVGMRGKKHINKIVDKTFRCHIVCQQKLMEINKHNKEIKGKNKNKSK